MMAKIGVQVVEHENKNNFQKGNFDTTRFPFLIKVNTIFYPFKVLIFYF